MRSTFILLAFIVSTLALPAFAYHLDSTGVIVDDNGQLARFNYWDAQKACPAGTHLPTVREWAQFAISRGAAGLEKHQDENKPLPDGFTQPWWVIGDHKYPFQTDTLTLNTRGYVSPGGELWQYQFATADNLLFSDSFYVTFFGPDARFFFLVMAENIKTPVRCFK